MRRLFSFITVLAVILSAVLAFSSPAAAQGNCPTPRLSVGGQGRVTPGSSNRIRDAASTSGTQVGQIPAGGVFDVLEGSQCIDGFLWWRVSYEGVEGWTVEGNASGYFVEPVDANAPTATLAPAGEAQACPAGTVPEPKLVVGMWGHTSSNTTPSRVRSAPSVKAKQVGEIEPAEIFLVLDGPVCADGYNWWEIQTSIYHFLEVDPNAVQGWTAEGQGDEYFIEPVPATATPAATRTPLPTYTPTITRTPLPTLTPSITPTPSDTPTPTPVPLDSPTHVTWSSDSQWLAVSTAHEVLLYSVDNLDVPTRILKLTGDIDDILFSPTVPEQLAVSFTDGQKIVLYDVAADQTLGEFPDSENQTHLFFTTQGQRLAALGDSVLYSYDVETLQLLNTSDTQQDARVIFATALTSDGHYLAMQASNRSEMGIFSTGDEAPFYLERGTGHLRALAFSPDNTKLVAGSSTGNIEMWDIASAGKPRVAAFIRAENDNSQSTEVNALAYSPDGSMIASGESNPQGLIRIFNSHDLKQIHGFGVNTGDTLITDVAFSPDGKYLAYSADHTVRILETESYTQVATLIQSR